MNIRVGELSWDKVWGSGWWGWQIKSQIVILLFTWSQWTEDYPRASGLSACRQCLWIWQRKKLSVSSHQGAGRCDGLNAEWDSEPQTHLNTLNTDDWTAARVLVLYQSSYTPGKQNHRTIYTHCMLYRRRRRAEMVMKLISYHLTDFIIIFLFLTVSLSARSLY